MKFPNKKSFLFAKVAFLLLSFFLTIGTNISAQSSATWNLTTSNTPVICGPITGSAPSAGSGVNNVTSLQAASGYSGTNFANLAANNNRYLQYSITNTAATAITVTNVNFSLYYNGTTYAYADFRYSTNNFASSTLLYSAVQANPGAFFFNGTASISVPAAATLTFRVYGYFADASTYRFGNTFFQVVAGPAAPGSFTATPVSGTQVNLSATANGVGNNVMLVYNQLNIFGVPTPGTSYVAGNTFPGGGTVLYVGPAGSPFFNHTGLSQGATYFYRLYSVSSTCALYSSPPLTATATTICPVASLNLAEGFNTSNAGIPPPCWTQQYVTGTSDITFQTSTTNPFTNPQEGTRFVSWNCYSIATGNQTRLVSPKITTTGTASVNAKFYWFHDNSAFTGSGYNGEGVTLQISTNGTTWTSITSINRALAGTNGWTVYDITMPGAGNQASLYVGFLFTSKFGDNCSMDNLLVYPTPTCVIPHTPLTASAIGLTTATISWAAASPAPALGYDYYVSTSPVAPTAGTTPTGSTGPGVTTANLSGLVANTDYYFWVRSKCSAADQSQWVGAGTFSTTSLYCSATSTAPGTWFTNQVSFVGTLQDVTNSSGAGATGFQNFTGLATKSIQAQGEGMNVYVQSSYSVLIKAWVDWNGNAIFDDPSELVYNSNGTLTSTTTFGFVIPLATPPGDYIIRIRTTRSGATTFGPCGVLPDGETEDYLFTVVPTCATVITAVGDGETCGSGPVVLTATGSAGTSEFRWYAAATGGVPLAATATGLWTTPSLSTTTVYYVTAYNGCESLVRTPVTAKISSIPTLTFTPASPVVCGEGAVLQLNASGDTEEGILLNEKFNSGLGSFSLNNILVNPAIATTDAQWQSKSNTYVPSNTTVWHPAISSGFGSNSFVFATSDLNPLGALGTGTEINTALVSPVLNSTGYLNLSLNFDIFYSHYLPDGNTSITDSVVVDVSTNSGTTWTMVTSYVIDQGIGTRFKNNTIPLNAYINVGYLQFRFRYHGNWTDGLAIDNVKLSGSKPLSTNFSWSPTGGGNLFTDASGTTPYVSGPVPNVYIKPTPAQIAAGTPLNFTATATLSNGCFASTPVTVTIGPSQWTGTISNDWHTANNWCSKVVPSPTTVVEIPSGTPFPPVISAAANAKLITILSGATLTINNTGSLSVNGNFVTQGILANNGRIELNGTGSQTFPGASGTITAMSILEINNSGSGVTLDKALSITKELRPTTGNLALGNNDITIKSIGANTASVSTVGASAGFTYGTGRFVVERYINTGTSAGQHPKSWQFITAPANGQFIKQSWMESGNPTVGYGTQVPGVAGPGGGFDAVALLPSMKTYVPASNTWAEVGNPNSTPIHNGQGYFIFVRGDRTVVNFSGANSSPVPTTLRSRGTIDIGNISSPAITAGLFQSVGNPYPSAVNFSTITRTGGADPNFYLFDPTLAGSQGLGGYQTITAATGYKATPGSTTYYNTTADYRNIQSGDAFFIHATGSGGGLNFKESDKVTASTLANRHGQPSLRIPMLTTNLLKVYSGGAELTDGNRVVFDNAFRNIIDGYDAVKISNDGVNFGLSRAGLVLAVEARKRINASDTVFYNTKGLRVASYKLMFVPENIASPGLIALLADKYLNTLTSVSLSDTSFVDMAVTEDPASAATDRFMLLFRQLSTSVPVTANRADITKLSALTSPASISVYPNPLEGKKLQLQFNNQPAGKYSLQLTDKYGQVVYTGLVQVTGKSFAKTINLNSTLSAGVYQLQIAGTRNVPTTMQVVIPQ